MSNRNGRESRDDALERILAETAKNPYTPKRPVRPQRPAGPAKPVVKTIPSVKNETEAVRPAAERKVASKPVSAPQHMAESEKPEVKPVQQMEEKPATSAAAKIAAIKRARAQSEQSVPQLQEEIVSDDVMTEELPVETAPETDAFDAEDDGYFEDDYDYDDEDYDYDEGEEKLSDYILGLVEGALSVILVVLLFYTYIIHIAEVDGSSMQPTLTDGDKLLVRSIMYTPENGDVVVIDNDKANLISESGNVVETDGLDKMIVKRVIATGGQTVDIDFETGKVSVDGNVLTENYISEPTTRDEYAFTYPLTIPEGYVFVMGDNRNLSMDSRHPQIGLVSEDDIVGEAFMRVYPFGDFGMIE